MTWPGFCFFTVARLHFRLRHLGLCFRPLRPGRVPPRGFLTVPDAIPRVPSPLALLYCLVVNIGSVEPAVQASTSI